MTGKVFLVGAGPGDPKLLTLRAAELIASADFIAIDALVSQEIAARVSANAEVVYVGKRAAAHTLPQDQINQLLIDQARKGKRVVRLKGGDPFVFGRGGEEAEELAAAGVAFEIVPGISSAIAGPAYAGIPVTHRSFATSLTLVTGHESDGSTGIKWDALAQLDGTIVFMMGFANLATIVSKLIEHGVTPDRPIAVISKATTPEQRTVAGTLSTIEAKVADANLPTPALIVVGDVVRMREVINWFETKPLFGKRIVITRAREQASELKRLFQDSGATVIEFPTIGIEPPESFESLDFAIEARFDWIVFTSANGVAAFFERLFAKGRDVRSLAGVRVACVGDTTAAALRERGLAPDLVPERFMSSALIPMFDADQKGVRIAVVRAAEGREEFVEEMRRRDADVHLAVAYRTVPVAMNAGELHDIDVVTFTSASTVDNFFAAIGERSIEGALLASIGPMTSEAIRRHGRQADVEAANAGVQALHDVVVDGLTD
ncbi:MAG: uroporphyrinogen methyltransferase / synthase [Thermoanaerobaculia bacterium]|jgi:uroporphyrinogen III methyltransferase/synthase|nr:uroporphyrinogen methyltransferase / synthase [Thermoanaerobaculia bacterium]